MKAIRRRIPIPIPNPINGAFDFARQEMLVSAGTELDGLDAAGTAEDVAVEIDVEVTTDNILVAKPGFILSKVPFVELQVVVLSGPHHQFAGPSEDPELGNAHGYTIFFISLGSVSMVSGLETYDLKILDLLRIEN